MLYFCLRNLCRLQRPARYLAMNSGNDKLTGILQYDCGANHQIQFGGIRLSVWIWFDAVLMQIYGFSAMPNLDLVVRLDYNSLSRCCLRRLPMRNRTQPALPLSCWSSCTFAKTIPHLTTFRSGTVLRSSLLESLLLPRH
jgi:hypothetical protein